MAGRSSSAVAASSAGRAPGEHRQPGRRRQRQLASLLELALGEPGGVPAHERLDRRDRHLGRRPGQHDPPTLGCRPHQRRCRQPAAQRLLTRGEARALDQRPGVEQQGGGVAVGGDRLGPRGGDDQARPGGDPLEHGAGARALDGHAGEGAAELFGGAPRADDRRPQPGPSQAGQRKPVSTRPHHRQAGGPCGPGRPSGPAQTVQRAGRRHSWQDSEGRYPRRGTCTSTGPCSRASFAVRHARVGRWAAATAGSRSASCPSPATRTDGTARRSGPRGRLDGRQRTALHEVGDGHRAGEPRREHRRAVHLGPGRSTSRTCG